MSKFLVTESINITYFVDADSQPEAVQRVAVKNDVTPLSKLTTAEYAISRAADELDYERHI